MKSKRVFDADLWIVVKPAPDVPGVWVSHCLNLDLMSQGTSAEHAFKMLLEVLAMTIAEDLAAGLEPSRRGRRTPAEDWAEQSRIVQKGHRTDLGQMQKRAKAVIALNAKIHLEVTMVKHVVAQPKTKARWETTPPAWQIAAATGGTRLQR